MDFNSPSPITAQWLSRDSTQIAPELIGCTLVRQMPDGSCFRGVIVETEAYAPEDPAMHAYRRPTARNRVMFGAAGIAYVYLIYGIYHCLNIVTDRAEIPSAVLIRALQLDTLPDWITPPQSLKPDRVAAGPGKLCRALKIDLALNATPFQPGQGLWLEHRYPWFQQQMDQDKLSLTQTTRIGLTKGVDLPWRWYLTDSPAVSRKG
ncbi:DNA-3-methyladenine glycosylase [Egbenema bharatensis]|uniref:DNA-3-methyladenine glycosylase n=1 Tax=Egbenema bharatensis TaxID=3463334 RepID=UPI003A8423E6